MNHFIIGTAGHIDHGKTALIKALTNIDCDTHPQEKRRGITINPGFAYLKKTDEDILAFVDVPGHQKFIHNMIAGAIGVDFIMLVISADDGVMPQTIEHLKICSLLGIKSGITVINKCDSVAPDFLEVSKEEVSLFLKGTFLEKKPVFCVSALKGTGIESLRNYLLEGDYEVNLRTHRDFFNMHVDRVFNVSGFGFIATGTVAGGHLKVDDTVVVLPKNKRVKVRNIQRHGASVPSCVQGCRVALDLAPIKREEIEPGSIIAEKEPPLSHRVDVEIVFIEDHYSDLEQFDALLLVGTAKFQIKAKTIFSSTKGSEKCALAQLTLSRAWYFSINEYFIIRNTANDQTIAGGFVVDPLPLVHKKITQKLLKALLPVSGNVAEYIHYKVNESISVVDTAYFSPLLQLKEENIITLVENSNNLICIKHNNRNILFSKKLYHHFSQIATRAIHRHNTLNPLSSSGVTKEFLWSCFKEERIYQDHKSNDLALNLFLTQMEKEGALSHNSNRWNISGYSPTPTQAQLESISAVEKRIAASGFEGLYEDDLHNFADILTMLVEKKAIYRHGRMLLHVDKVLQAKAILRTFFTTHPSTGIRVTEFRELLGTHRKTAMTYLDILEDEGFIYRDGDFRFLS